MRKTVTIVIFLAACALVPFAQASAKGLYVRDWITISVRTAPFESSKIIGLANTNDYLEVLEEKGEWIRVRTPEGKEGWVQDRYLTKQTPKALLIDQLNEKVKSLTENNQVLREENKQLQKDNRERTYKMSSLTKEIDNLKTDFSDLKTESAEYLDLKKKHEQLQEEFKAHEEKMGVLEKENSALKISERIIFTLVGGGFIILGLVLGVLLQIVRSRPKKAGYKF